MHEHSQVQTTDAASSEYIVQSNMVFAGSLVPVVLLIAAMGSAIIAIATPHHIAAAVCSWLILQAYLFFELRYHSSSHPEGKPDGFNPPQFIASFIVIWLIGTASFALGYYSPSAPDLSAWQNIAAVTVLSATLGLSVILYRYLSLSSALSDPHKRDLSNWARASVWYCGLSLGSVILFSFGITNSHKAVLQTLMFMSLLPGIEWMIQTLIRTDGGVSLSSGNVTIRVLFGRLNPVLSVFERLEHAFGVDIRSTWALAFIRRRAMPIALSLGIAGWLSTSLVVIDTFQTGLQERFGAPVSDRTLEPGIHVKAPWPIDTVERIDTSRVRTLTLGFTGPRQGASLLWTKQHAKEEYNLLLGDGRDLVTINALLHYKVNDPRRFHYNGQNPEDMLRLAAEQAILHNTVNRSLDNVLSENTSILAAKIETEIGRRARDYQIGIEVLDLSLQGLHPPIEVATDYQAVVSAQHEREISILSARSYEIQTLLSARGSAHQITQMAEADAVSLITQSRGDAGAFEARQLAHKAAPEPFEQRHRLAALKHVLSDQSFVLLDAAIEQDGGIVWFEDTP